jgi:hypothetical protein
MGYARFKHRQMMLKDDHIRISWVKLSQQINRLQIGSLSIIVTPTQVLMPGQPNILLGNFRMRKNPEGSDNIYASAIIIIPGKATPLNEFSTKKLVS